MALRIAVSGVSLRSPNPPVLFVMDSDTDIYLSSRSVVPTDSVAMAYRLQTRFVVTVNRIDKNRGSSVAIFTPITNPERSRAFPPIQRELAADAEFQHGVSNLPHVTLQGIRDHLPLYSLPRFLQRLGGKSVRVSVNSRSQQ